MSMTNRDLVKALRGMRVASTVQALRDSYYYPFSVPKNAILIIQNINYYDLQITLKPIALKALYNLANTHQFTINFRDFINNFKQKSSSSDIWAKLND